MISNLSKNKKFSFTHLLRKRKLETYLDIRTNIYVLSEFYRQQFLYQILTFPPSQLTGTHCCVLDPKCRTPILGITKSVFIVISDVQYNSKLLMLEKIFQMMLQFLCPSQVQTLFADTPKQHSHLVCVFVANAPNLLIYRAFKSVFFSINIFCCW